MRVFLSAGEPSGDHHAAVLVRAIKARQPDVECVGLGGPCMAAEGCRLIADMTQLAVMWFLRVLLNLHKFVDLARRAERSFLDTRPDVCVLVDFPGFHWWLAWRAKRHGIPVVFYCPPQIWAWGSWRIHKMRRLVDHVLSALPFEHDWFVAQGMSSTLVGHPFFDELQARQSAAADAPSPASASRDRAADRSQRPVVLLLPGSRGQEIEANLDTILRAAAGTAQRVPEASFVVGALNDKHAARVQQTIHALGPALDGLDLRVETGRTRILMREAACAIAVSGSVSLELLAARVPTVIVYRISGFAHVVQSWFRHARHITLVNLLSVREPIGPTRPEWRAPSEVTPADPEAIFPEYLVVQDPAVHMAGHVVEWLTQPAVREAVIARLDAVADRVAHGGSAERAAEAVLVVASRARSGLHAGLHGGWDSGASGPVASSNPCRPSAHAA
jgi:lipid-A-disaccharide synthase